MIISLLALSALSLVSYLLWLGTHNLHISGSHPHPTGPHGIAISMYASAGSAGLLAVSRLKEAEEQELVRRVAAAKEKLVENRKEE